MEDHTKFNLEDALSSWRTDLRSSGTFKEPELAELESHLRDEIAQPEPMSLSEEEQFVLAIHRIGSMETLKKAYSSKRIFNFDRISMVAQVVLGLFTFNHLNRIGVFITNDLFGTGGNVRSMVFLTHWGLQLTAMFGAFLLTRWFLRMSLRKGKFLMANLLSVGALCLSFSGEIIYAAMSPGNYITPHPMVVYFIPNLAYIVLLVLFAVITLKTIKKNRRVELVG